MPRRTAPKCQRRSASSGENHPLFDQHMECLRTGNPICRIIGGEPLDDPREFRLLWAEYGEEIMEDWREFYPGSRPMACYLLGEVRPVPLQLKNRYFRQPLKFGNDVAIHDRSWHLTPHEFDYLASVGIVKGAEKRRAFELWGRPGDNRPESAFWLTTPKDGYRGEYEPDAFEIIGQHIPATQET